MAWLPDRLRFQSSRGVALLSDTLSELLCLSEPQSLPPWHRGDNTPFLDSAALVCSLWEELQGEMRALSPSPPATCHCLPGEHAESLQCFRQLLRKELFMLGRHLQNKL